MIEIHLVGDSEAAHAISELWKLSLFRDPDASKRHSYRRISGRVCRRAPRRRRCWLQQRKGIEFRDDRRRIGHTGLDPTSPPTPRVSRRVMQSNGFKVAHPSYVRKIKWRADFHPGSCPGQAFAGTCARCRNRGETRGDGVVAGWHRPPFFACSRARSRSRRA